jgi:hypothetical protein
MTGGQYYFAPNASILKSIFRGIASNITKFKADGPTLNLIVPHNYISGLALATSTYIDNSSNSTNGSATTFIEPKFPATGNAEPNITTQGNKSILSWKLPSMAPGDKWGIRYQARIQGAGYVPLLFDTSNITYNDFQGSFIFVNISSTPGVNLGGLGAAANYLMLAGFELNANPSVIHIGESSTVTMKAKYECLGDGFIECPAIAYVTLYSNIGYFNGTPNEQVYNIILSGSDSVNFTSNIAGTAHIKGEGSNGNNSLWDEKFIVVKPRGLITVS